MKAKKENKVYNIDETRKEAYLKEGYDIYDDNDKIIEYSPKKVVKYNEYIKVIETNKKLVKEKEELTKQVEKLTKEKEELTKQVEKLTKEKEELIKTPKK